MDVEKLLRDLQQFIMSIDHSATTFSLFDNAQLTSLSNINLQSLSTN